MAAEPQDTVDEWASRRYPIEEDMAFQRRSWRVQRIGWAAMVLALCLAAAGFFSVGPLSTGTFESPDGRLAVEAGRSLRNGATATFRLRIAPASAETELRIDSSFLRDFLVDAMQPAPVRSSGSPEHVSLVFAAPPDGSALVVTLTVRPDTVGWIRTGFSVGPSAAEVGQLVYP